MPPAPERSRCDVVIVGGSHMGLSLALALDQAFGAELSVVVIERRPFEIESDPDPRAFAIAGGSRNLLDVLGVWPELGLHAQPVHAIDITDSSLEHAVRPVLLSYDNTHSGFPATYIVEAARLSQVLRARVRRASNITILAPADVTGFQASPAGADVSLSDGRSISARLVVAADGARSRLRELAGLQVQSWSYDQIGIVTVVGHERPHEGRAVQHFLPAGPFAVLPMKGNRSCVTWTEGAERGRAIMALDDLGFTTEIERRFGFKLGDVWVEGARASWPLMFHVARALAGSRLALIGDAARSVHPIAGQGLNLGFRDVAALAECLADGLRVGLDAGDATVLERYQRWRRFDSNVSAAAFGALNRLFSNDRVLLRAARDVGLGVADRMPGLMQLFVAEAAGQTGELPKLLKGLPL